MAKFKKREDRKEGEGLNAKMVSVLVEVELPTAKFVLKENRYISGTFIRADPEHPVVITLPEGSTLDRGLTPFTPEAAEPEKLVKPYVTKPAGGTRTAAEHFDAVPPDPAPPVEVELPKKPEDRGRGKGRPSDRSI